MSTDRTASFPPPGADATQAPAAASLAPGTLIDGTYLVERLLGEGGSGAVHLVRHQALSGARFALKVLRVQRAGAPEALAQEGGYAARVSSAHVVKVIGLGRLADGAPYLVMEYVDGPTLDALLADRELVRSEALSCGRQLCLALEAAHEHGLVHGDVSLRNLFATRGPDGRLHCQLGDFGLARRVRAGAGSTVSFEPQGFRGTPRFLAPEAIGGDGDRDQRSDVFSAGVVLYRLLAGVYPFDGETTREILAAILRGAPTPLHTLRARLGPVAAVVMRCLEPEPAARFESARALREALEAAMAQPEGPSASGEVSRPRARRTWARIAAGGAAVLASAAIVLAVRARAPALLDFGEALDCADTVGPVVEHDAALAHAVAQAVCARVGSQLDLDWPGGAGATPIPTRLSASAKGFVLEADLQGSHVEARGDTPLAAALELAQTLAARARTLPLSAEEIHRWGASDEPAARAVRAMWRRRTAMVIRDYAQEPRAVLAQDPRSPFAHFMLFHVERDPATVSEARKQLLANLDRLPPDRAAAMRGYVAVADAQDAPEAGLAQLKRAYSTSPDDLDVGLLYAAALEQAHDFETLEALAGELHARWPRKSLIALHWATASDDPAASDRLVQWLVAANPEQVCSTERIEVLIATGRIPEAEAACLFAQKLGVALTDRYIPETLIAFTSGDPTRIDRITVPTLAWTNSWPQTVAARLRLNGLLLTGRVAAAGSALRAQFAGAKASGATARALRAGTDLMTLHRRAGAAPLSPEDLDWMERTLDASPPALLTTASARTELALARDRAGRKLSDSRKALDALDAELVRRAAGDSMTLVRARLRTLPLVRLVLGSAKASDLWRASMSVPLGDKLQFAFEAALALDASDADTEAEQAFAVTITPIQLVEHAFDSEAARLRLADLYLATGREAQARPLLEQLDRAWSVADPGLRLKIRALR